jgi:hypothetical protein
MARQTKPESKLTQAADKATAMLQDLQSRLSRDPAATKDIRDENPEDLDRQLREYFGAGPGKPDTHVLNEIRDRVVDAVADRILNSWERGDRRELGVLENQIIDRVAQRILERMAGR